jgi:mRNA-degrading endonuclease toxin of MazEF toxin-antitoxin module
MRRGEPYRCTNCPPRFPLAPRKVSNTSAIQCDGLMSLGKSRLTDYVGELASDKLRELDSALLHALLA